MYRVEVGLYRMRYCAIDESEEGAVSDFKSKTVGKDHTGKVLFHF
jgi:hypothetical protein